MTTPQYTRLHNWQTRLEALLASRQAQPFAWGANDCCSFAAAVVQAITGQDPTPPGLRGPRTQKQALRALKRHGGITGIATLALGQPAPASLACVGDVVLCQAGQRDMLAVCNGTSALAPSASGLIAVPMGSLCWRLV